MLVNFAPLTQNTYNIINIMVNDGVVADYKKLIGLVESDLPGIDIRNEMIRRGFDFEKAMKLTRAKMILKRNPNSFTE